LPRFANDLSGDVLRVPGGGSTLCRDCVPIFYFFRRRADTLPPKSFGDLLNHHRLEIGQILTKERHCE